MSLTKKLEIKRFMNRACKVKIPVLLLGLLFSLVVLDGCSASRKAGANQVKMKKRSASYLEEQLAKNTIEADYFKAKVKVQASDISKSQSFIAEIRMKKDSIIWMSVYPPFGIKIEVARAIITQDSVKVLDRFSKDYYAEDIGYVEDLLNYPMDFATLQNLILGNRLIENKDSKKKVAMTETGYCLSSSKQALDIEVCMTPADYHITQLSVVDNDNYRTLNVDLSDYQAIEKQSFSHERLIHALTPSKYRAELKFSKIKLNEPLAFPFSVSKKYKLVDLNK